MNVALTVAEDDLSNDRLSNLRTVGSGFASLIYGLKDDIGFRTLYVRCLSVWAAYQKNMKLTDILVRKCIVLIVGKEERDERGGWE